MTTLTPGQTLIYIRDDSGRRGVAEPQEVVIERVARKWAYLKWRGYRISKETLIVDGAGYGSPGRCYLSMEHYHAEQAAEKRWQALARQVQHWNRRPGVTTADIEQAAALLRVELPKNV